MRYLMLFLLLLVPAVALAQDPVPADDVPVFSLQRVHLGAGLNYRWTTEQEWTAGLYGAYNLGRLFSLAGSGEIPFDSESNLFNEQKVQWELGVRVRLYRGGQ